MCCTPAYAAGTLPSVTGPLAVATFLLARVQVAAHHGRLGSRHHIEPGVALGLCVRVRVRVRVRVGVGVRVRVRALGLCIVALHSALEDAALVRVEAKAVP